MIVYLTRDWLVTTGLIFGVWTLVAIAVGIGWGKAVHIADQRQTADDATWLDDQPTEVRADDTREMFIPSAWFKPGTFDELA